MSTTDQIRRWMKIFVGNYVDECNEVDCTKMVEDWDSLCGTGEETIDPDHIAWDIAVEVADEYLAACGHENTYVSERSTFVCHQCGEDLGR